MDSLSLIQPENQELEAFKQNLRELDLNLVAERLITTYKWTKKQALTACAQYKNYLFLLKKYRHQYLLPPSTDIDEVWHNHILHTKEYIEFCNHAFGEYLHHSPGHGESAKERNKKFENLFETTQELYRRETGDYIYAVRPLPLKVIATRAIKKIISLTAKTNRTIESTAP